MGNFFKELRSNLQLVHIIMFVIAFLGFNFDTITAVVAPGLSLNARYRVLISLLIIGLLYWAFMRKKEFKSTHSLVENSDEEAEFFAKWYARNGKLMIFCTDLDWLVSQRYERVVDALIRKGNRLHLYLKDHDHEIVRRLTRNGATLYAVKPSIRSTHRFSIRIDDHLNYIIIRNKETEPRKITFEEYSNHDALVNLALDMLDDCYEYPEGSDAEAA
jgi:hypothetical protein